ncbi:MAG: DUF5777 family beta-barrel protein [Marinoscillum sp.]
MSSSNLFQDGHTNGSKEWSAALSASYNYVSKYEADSTNGSVKLEPYKLAAPWLQIQGQYGLTDRLDVGGSFGLGLFTLGFQGFSKLSLFPNDQKFGISAFGLVGYATLNENFNTNNESVNYYNFLVGLPLSYSFTSKNSLVFQPMISWDNYIYKFPEDGVVYMGEQHTMAYRLGLGWIHTNSKANKVHYNLALNYSEASGRVLPSLGIAVHPAK